MKIVVLSYESLYSSMMITHLVESRPGRVAGIVSSSCMVQGKGLPASAWYVFRRAGPEFVVRKTLESLQYKAILGWWRIRGHQYSTLTLAELAEKHDIAITESSNVNSLETEDWIREKQPDLILSVYLNQWIGDDLIALPGKGCLNIHPALLPRNRGLFPYFWVLANGESETGVTVHFVERGFDTGDIIAQEKIEVTPDDTVQSLSFRSARVGGPLLVSAVDDIEAGSVSRRPQDPTEATYFSWPTSSAYRRFRRAGRKFGSMRELMDYL